MKNGYRLNGLPIEYIGINQKDHYRFDEMYIVNKVIELFLIEYSQTGSVTYSNEKLQDMLGGCSRRGLQTAFKKAEDELPVFKRVFKDEGNYHRLGFEIDPELAEELLTLRPKDVKDLPRGNMKKHFVIQKTILIRKHKKELRQAYKAMKASKNKEKYQAIIRDLKAKALEYDNYIEQRAKKAKKSMAHTRNRRFTRDDVLNGIIDFLTGAGYKPPELHVN